MTYTLQSLERSLSRLYDTLFTRQHLERLDHLVILAAALGLLLHLALIALTNVGALPDTLSQAIGPNYLAALYTPFSFILFAEVLLLVLAIPESMTRSIGKQFEIVSLIVIRRVFKDLSHFESHQAAQALSPELIDVLIDMGGGLGMFLLVSLFYHIQKRFRDQPDGDGDQGHIRDFIRRKKIISLGLAATLIALAAYNLGAWGMDALAVLQGATYSSVHVDSIFYLDLFTVMIFTDVLILLLSMWHDNAYHFVFRNAGFVVSTILLRLSLTIRKPYSIELALVSMGFAIITSLGFHYFRRQAPSPVILPQAPREDEITEDADEDADPTEPQATPP